MNDQRKGLTIPNTLTFDEDSINACLEDIQVALKKYDCALTFQQTFQDGIPANPGVFVVVKNTPAPSKRIVHRVGNA